MIVKNTLSKLIEEATSEGCKMQSMAYDYDLYQYFDIFQMNDNLVGQKLFELPLKTWLCTYDQVGYFAMYLDGNLIGYRHKPYRKSDSTYYFLSPEHKNELHTFLKSCEIANEQSYSHYVTVDEELELKIEETYRW